MRAPEVLLEVEDLRVSVRGSRHQPVDGVSFDVRRGEVFGIVGESGSGKTLTTRAILQLLPQAIAISGGRITFDGGELTGLPEKALRTYRGARISLIPQHAGASLNPLMQVWRQVAAAMRAHGVPRREHFDRVVAIFEQLGLKNAVHVARSYPHQLSGGMQQRVAAAAALAAEPELLIADEPTSALDPLIQLQFIDLLKKVRAERATAMIFVTHDLGVIARICDRVAVMYAGRIMEQGSVVEILQGAKHPYTQGLLAATPDLARREPVVPIPGRPPLGAVIGNRCPFEPRCGAAFAPCGQQAPAAYAVGPGHLVRCWLHAGLGNGEKNVREAGIDERVV